MKNKKTIGLMLFGIALILITLIIGFTKFFTIQGEKIQETISLSKEQLTINGSKAAGNINVKGVHDEPAAYKNGKFQVEVLTTNKVFIPTVGNYQLYCVQRGTPIYRNKELVETIKALHGVTGTVSSSYHMASLPEKRYSNTYYVCKNRHTELVASGAYIITAKNFIAPTEGTYSSYGETSHFQKGEDISKEVRQVAMWLNPETNIGESFYTSGTVFTYIDMAEKLKNEAMDYKDYENSLKANVNEPIKETTKEKVKINVNQKEQYYIIGPYKMDYIEGNASSAKFAGISNMTVKGYNDKEKTKLIKEVNIESYIQNGIEQKLDFFAPTEAEGYVDRKEHSYPKSGEEFYIKIKNPNQGKLNSNEVVRYIDIEVEYSYMTAYAIQCELEGEQLVATPIRTGHNDSYGQNGGIISCTVNYKWNVTKNPLPQQKMIDAWGERNLYKLKIKLTGGPEGTPLDITMKLGGHVWEDIKDSKESIADGIHAGLYQGSDTKDRVLPNVKVTLYECNVDENGNITYKEGKPVGTVADLLATADKEQLTNEELLNRVNPQITNKDGYYQFDGLNSSNKYYVTFEYNGQTYLPTEYLVTGKDEQGKLIHQNSVADMVFNAKLYNTEIWEATSKGTESTAERNNYNTKYGEIGSSPKNYVSSNSLQTGMLLRENGAYYNQTFKVNDLMGYVLQGEGKYRADGVQLIDEFYEIDAQGNVVETAILQEGEISKRIQKYIQSNYAYPDENALRNIYEQIVNDYAKNNKEREILWKKLQYIEDCKIKAYTGSPFNNEEIDLYPVYDDFAIDIETMIIPGIGAKPPIYNGQFYVNLGLWRRAQNNVALKKDVFKAATKINGKTEVYNYDKEEDDNNYWEINLRMKDYVNYYGKSYNRELYPADYNYKIANTSLQGSELELYVTYKITIRNTSQNILNEITEVVDYYDKDYTYMPNLSWVMYKDNPEDDKKKIAVPEKSYYNMIANLNLGEIANARNVDSSYGSTENRNGNYVGKSIYGESTKQNLEEKYNAVYVRGLKNKKIATGENVYIYLTFKVNPDEKGPVILDEDDSLKQNIAEINGYKNYYADGSILPNNQVIHGNNTYAGSIDKNSTPGNLCLEDIQGERYEKNFEDDTDRAKGIKVLLDENAIRELNGTVWEDERTYEVEGAIVGDGVRQNGEIGVNGVTVELVEKLENGNEYVWQTTVSGSGKGNRVNLRTGKLEEYTYSKGENGHYEFTQFIPGNYIVRFQYGHNKQTVVTSKNGGQNAVSYNGQDFKNTVYGQDLKNKKQIGDYKDEYYNIEQADSLSVNGKANVSDAKDLWENKTVIIGRRTEGQTNYQNETYQGRTTVNQYGASKVNNYVAEILASPYLENQNEAQLQELMNHTHMVAQTGIIVTEVEYNRTSTDGYNHVSNGKDTYLYDNDKNSNYTINHVDFGLTERPKAQLELNKKVTNVKITLANGNTLFDASQSVDNLIWVEGKQYNLNIKMNKGKYEEYYDKSKKDHNYHRYSYREDINKLISGLYPSGKNGLIQASMDEELMHGATIQISYQLMVKNVGETDYTGQDFYYKASGTSKETVVTTTANEVIDYVSNNLQYREQDNTDWKIVKAQDLTNHDESKKEERLVNNSLSENLSKFNTIIQTSKLQKELKPGESVEKDLQLTQLITSQNTQDEKTYNNIAEIVQTSNTVGRRMAYSIVGNQDPTANIPSEVDTAKSEQVIILPPFGSAYLIYIGVAILVAVIIAVGIIFIKKRK